MTETDDLESVRARTRALCSQFPDEYWRETDLNRRYPQEFVDTLTAAGLLAALIPTEYGGPGSTLTQASVIMEEINKSGGHSAACHAQMYTMGALLRHGSDQLKNTYLPLHREGRAAPAGLLHHRARRRLGHHQHHHQRRARRRRTSCSPGTRTGPAGSPRVRPRPRAGPDQPQDRATAPAG